MIPLAPQDDRFDGVDRAGPGARLLASLQFKQASDADHFRAPASGGEGHRMFGGHLMAQAVVAAGRTVERGRMHAVQATFLRPGDRSRGTNLHVDRLFDGHSYHIRQVTTEQQDQSVQIAVISFHSGAGADYGHAGPRRVPPARPMGPPVQRFSPWSDQAGDADACPVDLRRPTMHPTENPHDDERTGADRQAGYRCSWLRAAGDVPAARLDELLHAALLAYASDLTPMESAMAVAGRDPYTDELTWATLSHSLWIHRAPRANHWLLCRQHCSASGPGRALVSGSLVDEDGHLVASFSQEGAMRLNRRAVPAAQVAA